MNSVIATPRESRELTPFSQANTAEEFKWLGSLPYIFSGYHSFQFRPSEITPGHTTFVNKEEFSGALSFMVAEGWSMGKKTKVGFEGFCSDLKARVEGA